jgi:addiction module HigA family antidote
MEGPAHTHSSKDLTRRDLVKDIRLPPRHINEIVHRKRSVTAHAALRLSRYLGRSDRFWLNLQASCEMDVQRDRPGDRLVAEVLPRADQRESECARPSRWMSESESEP